MLAIILSFLYTHRQNYFCQCVYKKDPRGASSARGKATSPRADLARKTAGGKFVGTRQTRGIPRGESNIHPKCHEHPFLFFDHEPWLSRFLVESEKWETGRLSSMRFGGAGFGKSTIDIPDAPRGIGRTTFSARTRCCAKLLAQHSVRIALSH